MKDVSPFFIKKAIDNITSNVTISRMRDGDLLLKTQNKQQADKLVKQTMLAGSIPIIIKEHATLNQTKGTINCFDLKALKDEVIIEELKDSGVIAVDRVKRRNADKKLVDTSIFILTFALSTLPRSIDVGFHRCKVQLYIPAPMRCTTCLRFNHKKAKCRDQQMCATCSRPAHGNECVQDALCINCNGQHNALSRDCPVYQDEYEIQRLCATEKISFREARQKRRSQVPNPITRKLTSSFAAVVRAQINQQQPETDEHQAKQIEMMNNTPTPTPTSTPTSTPIPVEEPTSPTTSNEDRMSEAAPDNATKADDHDRTLGDHQVLKLTDESENKDFTNTNEIQKMNSEIVIENTNQEHNYRTQEFSQFSQAIRDSLFVEHNQE
ncbi:uncharacterized protein LOC129741623 [Uranotaenia lowii]|nr:uncharacterized protein LOC129741623 [Uranotaenia lowii]